MKGLTDVSHRGAEPRRGIAVVLSFSDVVVGGDRDSRRLADFLK